MTNEIDQTFLSNIYFERELPESAIVDVNRSRVIIHTKDLNPTRHNASLSQIVNYIDNEKQKTESILTVKNTCRVCLASNQQNMVSLFSTINSKLLASMFVYVTSIEINPKENLPSQMCKTCQKDIIKCYNFKTKCFKSDNILRSLMEEKLNKNLSKIYSKSDKIQENEDKNLSIKVEKFEKAELQDIEYLEEDFFIESEDAALHQDDELKVEKKELNVSGSAKTKDGALKRSKKRNKHLECDICCKKFLKIKTLKLHIKQYHIGKGKKAFPCSQCKESFNSDHDRHLHMALHEPHDNKWTCNKCQKEFNMKNRLRRHIRRHMEWKRHECDACGKRFAELCSLRRHARVHTGELMEKKHHCEVCGKRFVDRAQLRTHVARHTGERACACDVCGKAFRSRRLLASHRRVHIDHKPYACLHCPQRFRHESTRNTHHRTHTGEKPYVCSMCGKTFIQNSNLTRHMRTHTGERPYTCDVCGRKFSSSSTLASHQRTHTGEKPYGCPICGKRFARKAFLSHAHQHAGERPFLCPACPKTFSRAARLRDHCFVHTDETPFECAICSDKFKKKSYLAKHLKYHHDTNFKNYDTELLLVKDE